MSDNADDRGIGHDAVGDVHGFARIAAVIKGNHFDFKPLETILRVGFFHRQSAGAFQALAERRNVAREGKRHGDANNFFVRTTSDKQRQK